MRRKPSARANVGHVQKLSSGRRLGLPMLRGRQECPADDPEPQRTPAAPHRPPASAQCRTCTGPCTLAGGSPRARERCRACLARPDASRRALSFAVRTVCPRDRSRKSQARMCAAALLAPFQPQVHAQLNRYAYFDSGEAEFGGYFSRNEIPERSAPTCSSSSAPAGRKPTSSAARTHPSPLTPRQRSVCTPMHTDHAGDARAPRARPPPRSC